MDTNKDLIPSDSEVDIVEKKEQLVAALTNVQYYPALLDEKIEVENRLTIPMGQIAALGTAFEPISQMFQHIAQGAGGSGLYWVNVPSGHHLAHFKGSSEFLGSALKNVNNQGFRQAALTPLACNPTLLFVAAVLVTIDKKLSAITEGQKEILAFLQQKEKSIQRGNLVFLNDILANYKFNYENAMYKSNNHIKVLDIKQTSEQSVMFYQEQIDSKLKKQSFLHIDKNVREKLASVKADLIEYRLALYLFAFSSFLEVLLLENFENAYLEGVKTKIQEYSEHYQEQYTTCYESIEKYSKTSVQSHVLKGLSVASTAVGKAASKVSLFNDTHLDKDFLEAGSKIGDYSSKRTENTMDKLSEDQQSGILPFIENITMINVFYNQPIQMLVDGENIYLPC